MLIAYMASMGAASTNWFHGSGAGVSTAATMKMMRIAY